MSINAISAGSAYYSSSIDNEYELIKRKLQALGIAYTGNKSIDKLKLEQVEKAQQSSGAAGSSNNIKANGPEKTSGPPPLPDGWKELMEQLGITSSGDVETDYKKAISVIAQKLSSTNDETEKSKYTSIQAKIERLRNDFAKSASTPPNAMIGATALSDMNKAMLVSKSS